MPSKCSYYLAVRYQKYLEIFEICWRRMEKISWTNRVENVQKCVELLHRFKEERNILHMLKKEGRLSGLVTLRRNCFIKDVIKRKIKGRIEVKGIP
jgi:hypothetical protein